MNRNIILRAALCLLPLLAAACCCQEEKRRLRREDSFLGVHFDFHAGPDCMEVGRNTTPEMVNAVIDKIHPDYLQIDCKGHGGYSSYPTGTGHQAPGIIGDPLKIWRDVTRDRGVALYMHYSGVWDFRAVELHPGWAVIGPDGKPSEKITSVFGPYADSLMIPQLKELAGKYQVDGAWIDGECWGTAPDYGRRSVALFKEMTGAERAPLSPEDPWWHEWKQFHREAFRNYLRHYLAEVHKDYPDFQICSNWAYSHQMSEPVSAAVDFLSGDYSPKNSVNSARMAARYLANQGLPWDLMAWSFSFDDGPKEQKPAVQLMQEAAVTLALGGGIQVYFMQNRDGSVKMEQLDVMKEVAGFARKRQPWCHKSVQIPQVALLLSTYDFQHYDHPEDPSWLYPQYTAKASGILQCLLDNQYSVDVVGEASLFSDMQRFPLIVVPECNSLSETFRKDLVRYAVNGGNLLIVGKEASETFAQVAGVAPDFRKDECIAIGQGRIGFIADDLSDDYDLHRTGSIRLRVKAMTSQLFRNPAVEVTGSHCVDVSFGRIGGRTLVHLVNTSGDHRNEELIGHIEPVGPLKITVASPEPPSKVVMRPSGKELGFSYVDGKIDVDVDEVRIYDIMEICYE